MSLIQNLISIKSMLNEATGQQPEESGTKFKPWGKGLPIPTGGKGPAPYADISASQQSPSVLAGQAGQQKVQSERERMTGLRQIQQSAKNPVIYNKEVARLQPQ